MDLSLQVAEGLTRRIESRDDWLAFQEIFVQGEYDLALDAAVGRYTPGRRLHVVDLGANTGLFASRVAAFCTMRCVPLTEVELLSVEASPATFATLRRLRDAWCGSWPAFRVVHGLVGGREGRAKLYASPSSLSASVHRRDGPAIEVSYVDLDAWIGVATPVDLLKCDIEGAEEAFLSAYPELLSRVRVLAIELHGHLCNTSRCEQLLHEAGFRLAAEPTRKRADGPESYSTRVYVRPP